MLWSVGGKQIWVESSPVLENLLIAVDGNMPVQVLVKGILIIITFDSDFFSLFNWSPFAFNIAILKIVIL